MTRGPDVTTFGRPDGSRTAFLSQMGELQGAKVITRRHGSFAPITGQRCTPLLGATPRLRLNLG